MGRTHPHHCEHGTRVGSDDFHDEPGRCEECDSKHARIAELRLLVKAATNRREEIRNTIEYLMGREKEIAKEMAGYCAELRAVGELLGIADVSPDRPTSREDSST